MNARDLRHLASSRTRAWATACALVAVGLATSAPAAASTPAADCQPFAKEPCLVPFPNNLFTKRDHSSATGRRVHLPQGAMPTNTEGNKTKVFAMSQGYGAVSTL